MSLFSLLLITGGLALPLLIEITKGKTASDDFRLSDLSKISAILLVYYTMSHCYYKTNDIDLVGFYYYLCIKILLTIAFIVAVMKYAPLRTDMIKLLFFPRFERRSILYFVIVLYFFYTSFFIYRAVEVHYSKVELQLTNVLMLLAINETPFFSMPALILTEIFSVIGEEIVFRYFAINALKNKMGKTWVILFSSFIFTLLHWDISLGIFILGVLLGYLYFETESLSLCIALHFISNLTVSTEIFYVFYKKIGALTFSAYKYAIAIFLLQVTLFLFIKMIFNKTGKTIPISEAGGHGL